MLLREDYLKKIREFYEADLIKVITGMRRVGKSVILSQIRDEIIKITKTSNVIEINFENEKFQKINTYTKLLSYIRKQIKNKNKYYIFLDEIQHVRSFEKALSSLRVEYNLSIFVTGSNSKLLSGRLATLLVGRCIEFKILPFSFKEAYAFFYKEKDDNVDLSFQDYIRWGGLPLRFSFTEENVRNYILQTYTGIVERDIVTPQSKINSHNFNLFSSYVLSNSGNELSIENVVKTFKNENNELLESKALYRYLDKMEKACLISRVKKYDINGKKKLAYYEKQYAMDTSLITINGNYVNIASGFVLENVLYNELIKRGYIVFVGKTRFGEVDFVVTNGAGKKCFIQVSYLLASEETINREFGAFNHIKDKAPKYVFSLDKFDFSRDGIAHINIIDFLLGKRSIELL